MAFWLLKTEPGCYSFDDLMAEPDRSTGWSGVRNHQARNMMRDQFRVGDQVFVYHSSADPPGIAGIAEVVEAGHPDPTAFDPDDEHYDPKGDPSRPVWYQVKIRGIRPLKRLLPLPSLRGVPALREMELLRKGSRLSVQPVRPEEWAAILEMEAAG